jgi:hypothetical protein
MPSAVKREFRALRECFAKELPRSDAEGIIRACEKQGFR